MVKPKNLAGESSPDRDRLHAWNSTDRAFPTHLRLSDLVQEAARLNAATAAVVFEGRETSYASLDDEAWRLALHLRAMGIQPGIHVAVAIDRSVELVVALVGVLYSGGAYVPFDPGYPTARLAHMFEDARVDVVVTRREEYTRIREALPKDARVVLLDEVSLPSAPVAERVLVGEATDLVYTIFTSGSTGRPKGAMNAHVGVVNLLLYMREQYGFAPGDRVLLKTAYSFDLSVPELFGPLISGGTLVLARPDGHRDPSYLRDVIQRERVSILYFVPSMLRALLDLDGVGECRSVQRVFCSGEALPLSLVEAFFDRLPFAALTNMYGPTEAAVEVTMWDCQPRDPRGIVPIGRPIANCRIHILDDELKPVPIGEKGELFIAGTQVGLGYVSRPELTAERFIPDPFSAGGRMYRSGDVARWREDGTLEHFGRADHQVKIRGFRIELGEIESTLEAHPEMAQVVAVAREEAAGDVRLIAYYIPRGEGPSVDVLRQYVGARLPEYMVPQLFVRVESFVVLPNGKVDRKALPAPPRSRPAIGPLPVDPVNARERLLCSAFADVLGLDAVYANDGFFELGGTSLLAMRLLAQLRERHGVDITVARFFQNPSPRGLDRAMDGERSDRRRSRANTNHGASDVAVAIVGMAGRFPGATDVAAYWENIRDGRDSITKFAPGELDAAIPREIEQDPTYVRARGIVDHVDEFDAEFFGIVPKDAELMDPQQRMFLELCWEAFENAGYTPDSVAGLVGVFAGMHGNTYMTNHVLSHPGYEERLGTFGVLVQNEKDYVATRVAHRLDLRGPALNIQTACSTSLVAVAEAFFSLRAGRCDLALAGAASVTCPPRSGYWYIEGGMLSPDGHTRPFDEQAKGTSFNDGGAVLVLKRLDDARRDGDSILGIIRGVGVNNDGAEKASFTAPSVDGQSAAIRMALDMARVSARDISYVEAHGTATPLGDPIEIAALTQAFREDTADRQFCGVSSVKGNIGHLVAAAGAAGLVKTLLSLRHEVIPPTAHFTKANPKIDFEPSPFFVVPALTPWPRSERPRLAGVSSFGVGGTNAHVVVEEPPLQRSVPSIRPAQLFLLSARTRTALDAAAHRLATHLDAHPEQDSADVAFTLAVGRRAFSERTFVVAPTAEAAAAALSSPAVQAVRRTSGGNARSVAFLFPGQGAQFPGMGRELYRLDPVFRAALDDCATQLLPLMGLDIRELLLSESADDALVAARLRDTAVTQPVLFAVEYAMAQVLIGLGVEPSAMVGHSIGEFVAATLSGVMRLSDALSLVTHRGRMMQALPAGRMLSVRLSAAEIAPRLSARCSIASVNAPALCVVAGPVDDIAALKLEFEAAGVTCRELQTSHAFHSPMMDPAVTPFEELVRTIPLSPPRIPFVSTMTGTWITDTEAQDSAYWAQHLRATVQFAPAIRTLLARESFALIEVGPRNTLITLARQSAPDPASMIAASTLGDGSGLGEWGQLLDGLGRLWTAGVPIDWSSFYAGEERLRVPLPTYPFERRRFWIDPARTPASHMPAGLNGAAESASRRQPVAGDSGDSGDGSGSDDPSVLREVLERQLVLLQQQVRLMQLVSGERN